jgi:hypothetical protein
VTCSPGSAHPQTGTGMPCCRTMWSPNSAAGLTSARSTVKLHSVNKTPVTAVVSSVREELVIDGSSAREPDPYRSISQESR